MIRNKMYTEHLEEITSLAEKINNTLDGISFDVEGETIEEAIVRQTLYKVADMLIEAERTILECSEVSQKFNSRGFDFVGNLVLLDNMELRVTYC